MPLPQNGTPWPPKELKHITPALKTWDAWYTGTASALEVAYAVAGGMLPPQLRPVQFAGGIVGSFARWFWGTPPAGNGQPRHRLHVPVAADICQAASDLLWAEAPKFTADNDDAQTRLDEMVEDSLVTTLAESTEIGAALGGSFLRVTWDKAINPDGAFLTAVHADAAWPEFRWGRLVAVTFWHTLRADGQEVWRHLERHELDSQGFGVIHHGVYRGSTMDLGIAIPLGDMPQTAGLVAALNDDGVISTESPGLAVEYVPNARPQRRWRKDDVGQYLGRSDLDGIEGLMDSLDEAYTALMRDVRLGKARVFVSSTLLQDQGPGQGSLFDADQEIYSPLAPGVGSLNPNATSGSVSGLLQTFQPNIRAAEHLTVIDRLLRDIVGRAGYSSATFGENDGAGRAQKTATEITADQQRSFSSRDKKIRLAKPRIASALEKVLAVDAAVFGSKVPVVRPGIEFPDGVQDTQLVLAQTAQALYAAEAASMRERVSIVHPDWDDTQVDAEVALIKSEQAAKNPPMMDPAGGFAPDEVAADDNAAG